VLLCDDELLARKRMTRLLGEIGGVQIVAECTNGEEVLARLADEEVDVLLLDIDMPGLSGIEAVARLPEDRPYVVFATAHPEHAVAAFEVGAVDYVLKPVESDRLRKALDRARAQLDAPAPAPAIPAMARLAIPTHDGAVLVTTADISHAVLEGQLVTVYAAGRKVLTGFTLQELEAKLPHFERVHRRALLNLDHVERLESVSSGGYVAHVRGGGKVEVSRQSARRLRRRLGLG
jgi:two-component system LytT family response regulator